MGNCDAGFVSEAKAFVLQDNADRLMYPLTAIAHRMHRISFDSEVKRSRARLVQYWPGGTGGGNVFRADAFKFSATEILGRASRTRLCAPPIHQHVRLITFTTPTPSSGDGGG